MTNSQDYAETLAQLPHKPTHQDGGSDKLSIAELSGEAADEQKSAWSKVSGKPTTFDPTTHTHTESEITDLDHDAVKIKGVTVDDTDKANGKVLEFNSVSGNLEYETPASGGNALVSRGDPGSWDWEYGNLTADGAWHDLDCSGIVPIGAISIRFRVFIMSKTRGSAIQFQKKGYTGGVNTIICNIQYSSNPIEYTFDCFCDTSQVVRYLLDNVTWLSVSIAVVAWHI